MFFQYQFAVYYFIYIVYHLSNSYFDEYMRDVIEGRSDDPDREYEEYSLFNQFSTGPRSTKLRPRKKSFSTKVG